MFKWLDKLLSRSYDKAADEVERVVKETQAPPFSNPTHPSKKKPRIGKDAQNLVLWLEKNEFYYTNVEGLRERCAFVNDGDAYCVEKIAETGKKYYVKYSYEIQLVYTDEETSWIFYQAKRIQDEREKQREKELKEQFKMRKPNEMMRGTDKHNYEDDWDYDQIIDGIIEMVADQIDQLPEEKVQEMFDYLVNNPRSCK